MNVRPRDKPASKCTRKSLSAYSSLSCSRSSFFVGGTLQSIGHADSPSVERTRQPSVSDGVHGRCKRITFVSPMRVLRMKPELSNKRLTDGNRTGLARKMHACLAAAWPRFPTLPAPGLCREALSSAALKTSAALCMALAGWTCAARVAVLWACRSAGRIGAQNPEDPGKHLFSGAIDFLACSSISSCREKAGSRLAGCARHAAAPVK